MHKFAYRPPGKETPTVKSSVARHMLPEDELACDSLFPVAKPIDGHRGIRGWIVGARARPPVLRRVPKIEEKGGFELGNVPGILQVPEGDFLAVEHDEISDLGRVPLEAHFVQRVGCRESGVTESSIAPFGHETILVVTRR